MANGMPAPNTRNEVTITSPAEVSLLLKAPDDAGFFKKPNWGLQYSSGGGHNIPDGEANDVQKGILFEIQSSMRALPPKYIPATQKPRATSSDRWSAPSPHKSITVENPPMTTYGFSQQPNSIEEEEPGPQGPVYHSEAEFSTDSELSPNLQAQQVRARTRLAILRRRVFRTRSNLREHRDRLRELRRNLGEAADKLTRKVSECVALCDAVALRTVVPLHEALRLAQDAVGPEEEEYDRLERRLDNEERELEQEEDHFDRRVDFSNVGHVEIANISESKLDEELSPLIKPYHPQDFDPSQFSIADERLTAYLEKIAEAEDLKQELDDLEDDYDRLTKGIAFRKRYRVPASQESIHFINIYPQAHEEALQKLYDIEDDVESLWEHCVQQKVFTSSEHIYTPRSALYEDIMNSVDEARARSPLRTAVNDLDYPDTEIDFSDKRDYINKWLLKWVQESSFETLLLRAYILHEFSRESAHSIDENWSKLALESWDIDHAGERANQGSKESRMDMILGDPGDIEAPSTAQRTGFLGILTDAGSLEINESLRDYSSLSFQSLSSIVSTGIHRSTSAPAVVVRAQPSAQ